MRLTVIGCGTAVPDPRRASSGYFVETDSTRMLLDCGPGVVHGLARAGVPWQSLTHVALTHFHNDHIGDLPALFFALKHGMRPRRDAPLTLIGPSGLRALVAALPDALGSHVREPGFPVTLREVQGGEGVDCGDAKLHVLPNLHTQSAVAYRVSHGASMIGYTGDTGPDDALAGHLQGCGVLVCECSLPESEAMTSHLTPASAARFARIAQPQLLVLTHVYPQLELSALVARVAAAGWRGATRVAFDGMVIEV